MLSKAASLTRVGLLYVIAFALASVWLAWGPDTDQLWLDGLIADAIATVVVFIGSRIVKNSSCYDPYWSVLPPFLAVYWAAVASSENLPGINDTRTILVLVVIFVWAIRLTANWLQDWPGLHHEDWRYPSVRGTGKFEAFNDLMGIHMVPTLIVFAALTPAYSVLVRPGDAISWLDIVALVIGIGAPTIQFISDAQMRRFIVERQPGQAMDRGLWSWSRHPNYFGEVSFWFSLALFGIAAQPGEWWWLGLGFLGMLAMFEGVSIPMMEKRSLERRPSYQEIIDRVPRLFPLPPRKS